MAWLSGWTYRKSHEIEGSSAGAQTDYQIKIVVHKGDGESTGEDVYCHNHCQDDFGDIRFTKSNGTTELPYWMEDYTSGDQATFWVKIDSIPASPDTTTIYIYYGTEGTTETTSSHDATFKSISDVSSVEYEFECHSTNAGDPKVAFCYYDGSSVITPSQETVYTDLPTSDVVFSVTKTVDAAHKYLYDGVFSSEHTSRTDDARIRLDTATGNTRIDRVWLIAHYSDGSKSPPIKPVFAEYYNVNEGVWYETTSDVQDSDDVYRGIGTSNPLHLNVLWEVTSGSQLRKHVDPEPSHGSWGTEETAETVEYANRNISFSIEGVPVHLSSKLTDNSGNPLSNKTIHWLQSWDNSTFEEFGTSTTNSQGIAVYDTVSCNSRYYKSKFAGDTSYQESESSAVYFSYPPSYANRNISLEIGQVAFADNLLTLNVIKLLEKSLSQTIHLESKFVSSFSRKVQETLVLATFLFFITLKKVLISLVFTSKVSIFFSRISSQMLSFIDSLWGKSSVLKIDFISLGSQIFKFSSISLAELLSFLTILKFKISIILKASIFFISEKFKRSLKVLLASLGLLKSLALKTSYTRLYSELLSLVETIKTLTQFTKALLELLNFTTAFSRLVSFKRKTLESLSLSGVLFKFLEKLTLGTLGLVESLKFQIHSFKLETLSLFSKILRSSSLLLEEILSFVSKITKILKSFREETLLLAFKVLKIFSCARQEFLSLTSKIFQTLEVIKEGSLSFLISLSLYTRKKLLQALNISPMFARVFESFRNYLEPLSLTDSLSKILGKVLHLYEGLSLTSLVSTLVSLMRVFSESLSLVETYLFSFFKKLEDSLMFLDISSKLSSLKIQDLISLISKSLLKTLKSIQDTLSLSLRKELSSSKILLEEFTFLSKVFSKVFRKIVELINLVDSLQASILGGLYKYLYEEINFSILLKYSLSRKIKEVMSLFMDLLMRSKFIFKESQVLVDTLTKSLISYLSLSLQESISLVSCIFSFLRKEVLSSLKIEELSFKKSLISHLEALKMTSTLSLLRSLMQSLTESLKLIGEVSIKSFLVKIIASYLKLSESFQRSISYFRSLEDSLSLTGLVSIARRVWLVIKTYTKILLKKYYARTLLKKLGAKIKEKFEQES